MKPFPSILGVALLATATTSLLGAFAPFQYGGALPPPPEPPENPTTPEKAVLGKILFWEEQLSSDNTLACGTCHAPGASFTDPREPGRHPGIDGELHTIDDVLSSFGVVRRDDANDFSPDSFFGLHRQATGRRTNDVFGALYAPEIFWDGRAGDTFVDPETGQVSIPSGAALETQAAGPMMSDVEMSQESRTWAALTHKIANARPLRLASDWPPDVAAAIATDPTYPELFEHAFGSTAVTAERICFAIAAYERTLVPDQSPWDDYVAGNSAALTADQEAGWLQFNGAANCHLCHEPPVFSDGDFHNIGIRHYTTDFGRALVTNRWADRGKFKTPSLRNAGLRPSFFHTGTADLRIVRSVYLDGGGPFHGNLDPLLQPLRGVPGVDMNQVLDFVANGLTDPRVANEQPPFDRPTLYAERHAFGENLFGRFATGSGGRQPLLVGHNQPAFSGNDDFEIGVDRALGNAPAWFLVSHRRAQRRVGDVPVNLGLPYEAVLQAVTAGSGVEDGWASADWPVPQDPNLVGRTLFVQAFVEDPGAPNGRAAATKAAGFVIE